MKDNVRTLNSIFVALHRKNDEVRIGLIPAFNSHLQSYYDELGKHMDLLRYPENHAVISDQLAEELLKKFFDAVENAAKSGVKDKSILILSRLIVVQLGLQFLLRQLEDHIPERSNNKQLRTS